MQTWMILFLWLIYLGLTANLEPSNLVVGLVIALTLTAFLHPDKLRIDLRQVPGATWALVRYVVVVAKDVIQGGIQVARLVLDPKLPVKPGVIAIPSDETICGWMVRHQRIEKKVIGTLRKAKIAYTEAKRARRAGSSMAPRSMK